jgi:hypothetical protein
MRNALRTNKTAGQKERKVLNEKDFAVWYKCLTGTFHRIIRV